MARVNKSLKRKQLKEGKEGHFHRDHRSKKNRRKVWGYFDILNFKKKKEKLILESIE